MNAKVEKLESKKKEIEIVNQKCRKCNIVVKGDKSLQTHMKEAHGTKQGKKCTQCPEVLATEVLWRKHIKDHLMDKQFFCEICMKTFQVLEEAQSHSTKPCGPIKEKEVVVDIEDSEECNTCNACSKSFKNNEDLEKHIEEKHDVDCPRCKVTFDTQDDVYKHANECTAVIEPFMCEKCNRELISKVGLKKHIEKCKGENMTATKPKQKKSTEKCFNGPSCVFLKRDGCRYVHDKQDTEQPWTKVQRGKKQRAPLPQGRPDQQLSCDQCKKMFKGKEEKRRHVCTKHQSKQQEQEEKRKNTECRRGSSCFRLANNTCWFKHSELLNKSPQRGQGRVQSVLWCQFQDQCNKSSCTYKHFEQDFLQRNPSRNQH